ncbi:DUF6069 family protein [Streptomyces sp. NPDC056716]|uniref:DUF6069 family protein n=1 Tax=unclassified Streptomyces TaxID=2593676 RepID=UPI0036B233CB
MTANHSRHPAQPGGTAIAGGLLATAVLATALNAAVAAIAHAAGASEDSIQLQLGAYGVFTVLGVLAGAGGWAAVRARAARPERVLRTLVPVVLLVSFVPDIPLGLSGDGQGSSWGAVAALMVMHVVVALVAVPAYRRLLPLAPAVD